MSKSHHRVHPTNKEHQTYIIYSPNSTQFFLLCVGVDMCTAFFTFVRSGHKNPVVMFCVCLLCVTFSLVSGIWYLFSWMKAWSPVHSPPGLHIGWFRVILAGARGHPSDYFRNSGDLRVISTFSFVEPERF